MSAALVEIEQRLAAAHAAFVSAGADLRVTIESVSRQHRLDPSDARSHAALEGWRLEREVLRLRAMKVQAAPERLQAAEGRWQEHLRSMFVKGPWPEHLKDQIIDSTIPPTLEERERTRLFMRASLVPPFEPANDLDGQGPAAVVDPRAFRAHWGMREAMALVRGRPR